MPASVLIPGQLPQQSDHSTFIDNHQPAAIINASAAQEQRQQGADQAVHAVRSVYRQTRTPPFTR